MGALQPPAETGDRDHVVRTGRRNREPHRGPTAAASVGRAVRTNCKRRQRLGLLPVPCEAPTPTRRTAALGWRIGPRAAERDRYLLIPAPGVPPAIGPENPVRHVAAHQMSSMNLAPGPGLVAGWDLRADLGHEQRRHPRTLLGGK